MEKWRRRRYESYSSRERPHTDFLLQSGQLGEVKVGGLQLVWNNLRLLFSVHVERKFFVESRFTVVVCVTIQAHYVAA